MQKWFRGNFTAISNRPCKLSGDSAAILIASSLHAAKLRLKSLQKSPVYKTGLYTINSYILCLLGNYENNISIGISHVYMYFGFLIERAFLCVSL